MRRLNGLKSLSMTLDIAGCLLKFILYYENVGILMSTVRFQETLMVSAEGAHKYVQCLWYTPHNFILPFLPGELVAGCQELSAGRLD